MATSDDDVRIAVAASRNRAEALRMLGLAPRGGNYRSLERRVARLGVDTTHWPTFTRRPQYDEEELARLVAESVTLSEVIRKAGRPISGTAYRQLRLAIAALGLDASHMLGSAHARGKQLPPRVPLSELLVEGGYVQSTYLRRRLIDEGVFAPRCASCRLERWLGRPIPLELDHISGDPQDNRLENLRLLCPNCHARTPTYRGRNVGRLTTSPRSPNGQRPGS